MAENNLHSLEDATDDSVVEPDGLEGLEGQVGHEGVILRVEAGEVLVDRAEFAFTSENWLKWKDSGHNFRRFGTEQQSHLGELLDGLIRGQSDHGGEDQQSR